MNKYTCVVFESKHFHCHYFTYSSLQSQNKMFRASGSTSLDKLRIRETYFKNTDGSVQKSPYILLYLGHASHCLKRVFNQREKSSNWPLGSCVHTQDFKWFRTFEWLQKSHILITVGHPPRRVIHPSVFIQKSLQAQHVLRLHWELWEEFSISKKYIHCIECKSLHFSLTLFLSTKFYLMVVYKT